MQCSILYLFCENILFITQSSMYRNAHQCGSHPQTCICVHQYLYKPHLLVLPMKRAETLVLKNPDQIKVVVDETRRGILSLLRFNDLTVSQIADVLQKDQSTIYRHMSKLEESGFVEVRGEKKTHHIPEKVYTRTAHFFILVPESEETSRILESYSVKRMEQLYHLMKKMGANIKITDEMITEGRRFLVALRSDLFREYEKIDEPLDVIMLKKLELFLILLQMEENEEFRERVFQFMQKLKA